MAAGVETLISADAPGGGVRVDPKELVLQVQALHDHCFRWALTCCDNRRDDAEDVLQDVYAGVLNDKLRFHGDSTLKTWLFGVIRLTVRARMRRERLREFLGLRHAARIDGPAPARPPDERAAESDSRSRTLRALAALPRRQREVLLLVFYHDLTIEESAKSLGVSLGSARTHYERGKKRMARLLNGVHP